MYPKDFQEKLQGELAGIREGGLYKSERVIVTPQGADIKLTDGSEVINFCANNYLGLSSHPKVIEAAHKTLDTHGFGMSSVRFICGTQDIHKTLEKKASGPWPTLCILFCTGGMSLFGYSRLFYL